MDEISKPPWPEYDLADPLLAYSHGRLSRQRAMDALGINYGELLDRLADRRLPRPQLPDTEIERMAGKMVEVLDQAAGR